MNSVIGTLTAQIEPAPYYNNRISRFLWLIPEYLLEAFPDRIINIHPALLPKYGGKGMQWNTCA